jgi:hypothetical protein
MSVSEEIVQLIHKLPQEKQAVVYDFVSYLVDREAIERTLDIHSEAFQTMLASEAVLALDWSRPEEDEAWADL